MRPLRCLLILLIVLLPAGPFATTFPVTKTDDADDGTCDSDCSLREAIGAANTNVGADDVPVPAGTYLLTLGQLTVTDDVEIAGAGQVNTIVDGNAAGRVFEIQANNTVDISDVTIQNGAVSVVPQLGGGILNSGTLTLSDSTLSGNRAIGGDYYLRSTATGAGLFNYGSATLTNTTVTENTSDFWGGGLYNAPTGTLTVSNSTVSDNYANFASGGIGNYTLGNDIGTLNITNSTISGNSVGTTAYSPYYPFGGYAGGIGTSGATTLTDSTVTGNTAGEAGGIGNWGYGYSGYRPATLTLVNTTVSGNVSESYGGGIENFVGTLALTNSTVTGNTARVTGGGILNSSGTLNLTNSTVSENHALAVYASGGGIFNLRYGDLLRPSVAILTNTTVSGNSAQYRGGGIFNSGSLTLTSSTVSGNYAGEIGGGIANFWGNLTLTNSTVSGNDANESGAGIYGIGGSSYYRATLTHAIVAGNGTTIPNCNIGAVESQGYNLTDDNSCGFTAAGDLVVTDAVLGPLANNGGPTETHALLVGSPAIDAGSPDCPPPDTDQRGVTRPQGAGCDIGAFELRLPTFLIEIDIKPGSDPNSINPFSRGVVPVATFGSGRFDVADIDLTRLTFGIGDALPANDRRRHRDIDADGFPDLLSHFRIAETGIEIGDTHVCLHGETLDGAPFSGCDTIRTVPDR